MRITNTMMTNNILLNINKNREVLDNYSQQLSSGKKIQKPSDNPIIAVRALKFRTDVKEIEQYKTNANDAISWISVTEQAVTNVTDIMKRIRDLAVQSSSSTYNLDNRKNAIAEVEQLMAQFMNEGNATYAGRHIFSGYKTDTKMVFTKDTAKTYTINETFKTGDLETLQNVVDLAGPPATKGIEDTHRIRLGYKDVVPATIPGPTLTVAGLPVNVINSSDINAFQPVVGSVNFLQDTGELYFHTDNLAAVETALATPGGIAFDYDKNLFAKGELLPETNFNFTDATGSYTLQEESMQYQISYSQEMNVNTMGYELITPEMYRDIQELVDYTVNTNKGDDINSALRQDLIGTKFSHIIGKLDKHINNLLNTRSSLGGKINRLELTINRLSEDGLNFKDLMSKNEDADLADVMIKMSAQSVVYNASLASSSKIIQQTLLDFLR